MPDQPSPTELLNRLLDRRNELILAMAGESDIRAEDARRLSDVQGCIQAIKETQLMLAAPGL